MSDALETPTAITAIDVMTRFVGDEIFRVPPRYRPFAFGGIAGDAAALGDRSEVSRSLQLIILCSLSVRHCIEDFFGNL